MHSNLSLNTDYFRFTIAQILLAIGVGSVFWSNIGHAENVQKVSSISLYDYPKYTLESDHFDYANPEAVKGGKITLPALGTYDTLNPYVLKGIAASDYTAVYGITERNEPLMAGTHFYLESGDEAQSAYCLVCETLEFPADYSWVVFTINPRARFHNGDAITAHDVAFSYTLLMSDQAHPVFANNLAVVASVKVISDLQVKFLLKPGAERSALLRIGEIPVMSKNFWSKHTFGASSGIAQPLSGPYQIKEFVLGNYLILERVKDFWSKDHPSYRGMFNFDEVRFDFYRDRTVAFEAFKSGGLDFWIEYVSKNWVTGYDFPAIHNGTIIKKKIPHQIPANTQSFFMNTRRPLFSDVRVRKALTLLFDYDWLNKNIFSGAYRRSNSYYANSKMGAQGLPTAAEMELLEPIRDKVPKEVLAREFSYPSYSQSMDLRNGMKGAIQLLKDAGWEYQNSELRHSETGQPFEFEFLINSPSFQRVLIYYASTLKKVGIKMNIRVVDSAQYKVRLDAFDFDMTVYVLPQPAMPGHEQRIYFSSEQADIRGSRNLSGIKDPAVDYLLNKLASAKTESDLMVASRLLDRVLLWNYYSILNWYSGYHRIAYKDIFARPQQYPQFILGFHTWWLKADSSKNQSKRN